MCSAEINVLYIFISLFKYTFNADIKKTGSGKKEILMYNIYIDIYLGIIGFNLWENYTNQKFHLV